MQYKNNYNIPWTRDDGITGEGIFNGDIGVLTEIKTAEKKILIQFSITILNVLFFHLTGDFIKNPIVIRNNND